MDQPPAPATLAAEHLHLAYDRVEVAADLTVAIPPEQITVIVGANACGKSTLLRALARLLKTKAGVVLLDGRSIHGLPTKAVASRLGILPQTPIAPEGISVADLVARGRYPHQSWFRQWTGADERIVATAMEATGVVDLAHQVEILDLLVDLNRHEGPAVVLVLHEELVQDVFALRCLVVTDPVAGTPLVVPLKRRTAERRRG